MVEVGIIVALTLKGTYIGDYDKLREVAQESERLGIDSLWHCDHFVTLDPASYGSQTGFGAQDEKEQSADTAILEPWTTLAALARDTERLRLGTLVSCVGYRPPAMLAKTAATVDVISKGRVDFGIGAGWIENEYHSFGYPYPNAAVRIEQLEEAIQLIRAMWTESAPHFEGGYFQIQNGVCDPPPVQKPHPPIWTGGEGPKLLGVSARQADGYNCRWWTPEQFLEKRPAIEAECKKAGRDPDAIRASLMVMVIPEKDRAVARAAREKLSVIPESGSVYGTPDDCVARLKEYPKAGVDHILVTIPDLDVNPHRLTLMGEEIIPALQAGGG